MELLIEDPHKHKEKERGNEPPPPKKKKRDKEKSWNTFFFQISSSTFQDLLQDAIWMLISTSKIFNNSRKWIFKPNIWNGLKQNWLKRDLLQSNLKNRQ